MAACTANVCYEIHPTKKKKNFYSKKIAQKGKGKYQMCAQYIINCSVSVPFKKF